MTASERTPEFLDDETGVESNDPVCPNPASEWETALREIGRIEGDAVVGLGWEVTAKAMKSP